jgi:endonuclease/exonuclease/phosphatase family metal-dependent hydrolase
MSGVNRIRVLTLNIWNNSGPWAERVDLIREELCRLDPDIFGLQEVLRLAPESPSERAPGSESDQALKIAAGLNYEIAYGPATRYGQGLTLGNALLSRFPIVEERNFSLPGEETGETRALLHALVKTPSGLLPVFVTHLNWKLHHGSVRLEQVRFIADRILEVPVADDSRLPAVLMGDFNAEPDSDEIRFLRGLHTLDKRSVFFADAWIYGHGGGSGYTFDRKNCFAALAHEAPRRIDYIFVHGPDGQHRGEPLRTTLAFQSAARRDGEDIWPSDHFGVFTELSV